MSNWFFLIGFGMVLIVCFTYVSFIQHEQAHVQINKYFGSDSVTRIGFGEGGVTAIGFENEEKKNLAYVGHSVNEAVAYNITPLLVMIGIINVLGFVYLGEKVKQ